MYMHNIYYTTILDVIIQCELGREPGGQRTITLALTGYC